MSEEGAQARRRLLERLEYRFGDPDRFELALTHPSHASERPGSPSNERLEFLGDAVLDLAVAQLLYESRPDWDEGRLSRARAALVNTRSLAQHAQALGIDAAARLGRTEQPSGRSKPSILANLFEAVVGALYLDGGLAPVRALARRQFAAQIEAGDTVLARDPKTHLQEWAHAERRETPRYRTVGDTGVENDEARFRVEVSLGDAILGSGCGRTKRAAERAAAAQALEQIADPVLGAGGSPGAQGSSGPDAGPDA